MGGFVKEYWSIRALISTLFSMLRRNRWTHEVTYLKPKALLEAQVVKRRLPFENGGIYTVEEITYFKDYFKIKIAGIDSFHDRLENPDNELATHFWEQYAPVKRFVQDIEQALGNIFVARARIAFPQQKGKRNAAWLKKPLQRKLIEMTDDQFGEWEPSKLPGFKGYNKDIACASDPSTVRRRYYLDEQNDELKYEICAQYCATSLERAEEAE
jgi:hypothetical protein